MRLRRTCALVVAAAGTAAVAASADPLDYPIRPSSPLFLVRVEGDIAVRYGPPLLPPVSVSLLDGSSAVGARPTGSAVADVGLPGGFQGGAQGIVVSDFSANLALVDSALLFTDIFGQLPPIPSPVPLVGAAYLVDIADLEIVQEAPLSSALSANGPNDFSWSGSAPLTVNGTLNVFVAIPGQEPIGLSEPVPFSVPLDDAPLLGAFSGDVATTTLEIGIDALELESQTSATLRIDLGAVGALDVDLTELRLVIDGTYTGVNRRYGLPPAGPAGVGCGLGPELALLMPALGWLRRRRRRV